MSLVKEISTKIQETQIKINANSEIMQSFSADTNGTVELKITDQFITNFNVAKSRANKEFIKNGYITKRLEISTYYLKGLSIGNTVKVGSFNYVVISIKISVKGVKRTMNIICERYKK